jgi:hypothetical protein
MMARGMRRRTFLATLAAIPARRVAAGLAPDDDVQVFRELATAIGGVLVLPKPLAEGCAREFVRTFGDDAIPRLAALARSRATLAALRADATAETERQLRWIANFLYTGETPEGAIYASWCLAWGALDFTTAPGQCGGPFGHWEGRPG